MAAPLALAGASLFSSGLNAWMNWKGMQKGEAAQNEANRLNIDLFEKQQATEIGEKKKDRKFRKEEQKRNFGQRNYETFLVHFSNMLNSKPKVTNNLIALQRARGQ